MSNAPRDENSIATLLGVSTIDYSTPVTIAVDPSTHAIQTAGGAGGTQYQESTTTSPATGTVALGRYTTVAPTLTNGQLYGLQLDASGNLKVTGSLSVGGTTDNSAFTAGSGTGTPSMAFYHSVIDTVTDGHTATLGMTNKRALFVNLQNSSGTEIGTASNPVVVNANAGTNLNTSLLALESGGNLASIATNTAKIPAQGQALAAASMPVVLPAAQITTLTPPSNTGYALDSSLTTIDTDLKSNITLHAGTNIIGKVTTDQTTHGTTDLVAADITKVGGTAFALGQQLAAGSLPVVLTSAQITTLTPPTSVTVTQATGTNLHSVIDSGSVTIQSNASVNIAQIAGTTTSVNTGTVDAGTQRVVQANGAGKTIKSASGSASTSGNNTLVAAGTNKLKVFAFSLSTSSTTAITCKFQDGASGTDLWSVILQAPTSVSTGANLAVSPPAWLFNTSAATLLNLNLSSANAVQWSVSYFEEA